MAALIENTSKHEVRSVICFTAKRANPCRVYAKRLTILTLNRTRTLVRYSGQEKLAVFLSGLFDSLQSVASYISNNCAPKIGNFETTSGSLNRLGSKGHSLISKTKSFLGGKQLFNDEELK